jgi:hypothetical protein
MEHSIAQHHLRADPTNAQTRNLSATMAAAVAGTVGRAIGDRVGAYAQERIRRLKESSG